MGILNLIGRISFGVTFLAFGALHLLYAPNMIGAVPPFIPGGVIWVYVTGVCMIAAGIAIVTKIQIYMASILLAILLLIYIVTVHLPGMGSSDVSVMQDATAGLLKALGLMGGALYIAGHHKR